MATVRGPSCFPLVPLSGCFPISANGSGLLNLGNDGSLISIVQVLRRFVFFEEEAPIAKGREEEEEKEPDIATPGPTPAQFNPSEAGNAAYKEMYRLL